MGTCDRCYDGRHLRCADKLNCSCSVCGKPSKPTTQRAAALRPRAARTRPAPTGRPVGRPPGSSTLDPRAQRVMEIMLQNGAGLSEVARALDCSRDQARTIRKRLILRGV